MGAPSALVASMGDAVDKVEVADNGWNLFVDLDRWLPWMKGKQPKLMDDRKGEDLNAVAGWLSDAEADEKVKQRTEELKNKLLIRRLNSYRLKAAQHGFNRHEAFVPSEPDVDSSMDLNEKQSELGSSDNAEQNDQAAILRNKEQEAREMSIEQEAGLWNREHGEGMENTNHKEQLGSLGSDSEEMKQESQPDMDRGEQHEDQVWEEGQEDTTAGTRMERGVGSRLQGRPVRQWVEAAG